MFSPTLINEARFGFSREHTNRLQPNGDDTSDLPGRYGILGVPQLPGNGGLPALRPTDLSQLGHDGWVVSERFSNTLQFSDNLTKVYKSHTFKTGYTYQNIFFGSTQPPYARGEYYWDGRYTSVVDQTDNEHVARPVPAARRSRRSVPGGVDFSGRHARHPRLAVRGRRCVQDLSRRLRAGQLARLAQADGERRPALGLLQPRAGAGGGTGQHGAGIARTLPDSRGVARRSRCRRASSTTWRRTTSSWSTPTSSAAASGRCRRTTSRRASMPRTSWPRSTCCAPATACFTAPSRTAAATRAWATTIRSSSRCVYQSPNAVAPNRLGDGSLVDARRARADRAGSGQRQRQRPDPARRRVRLQDPAVSQLQRDAPDRSCARITRSRSGTSARRGRNLETFTGMNNVKRAPAAGHEPAAVRGVARLRAQFAPRPDGGRELLRFAPDQVPAPLSQGTAVPRELHAERGEDQRR